MSNFKNTSAWQKLENNFISLRSKHLRDLFKTDPYRFEKFSIKWNDIFVDYSKNIIDYNTFLYLMELANEMNLKVEIEKMFNGERINNTEKRSVLHVALRNSSNQTFRADGTDIVPNVTLILSKMRKFVDAVHSGRWVGCTGERITDVVNIGIGGSDLGPAMVCRALSFYSINGIKTHFVSNVDGDQISYVLKDLNPASTLFIIASKTFTTQETIANANSAKKWLLEKLATRQDDLSKHFIAISTNEEGVKRFGINVENMYGFWNWVGGRYSLWSAIGMPIALQIGMDNFLDLLEGAHEMDNHFRNAPFEENLPVILGMLGIWYINLFKAKSQAIIPYDQNLELLADWLQQLDMESNGKGVTKSGETIEYSTGPIIWGKPGTNAQHSFFQLLHQGKHFIPVDFLIGLYPNNEVGNQHQLLISNFLAQTEALMIGKNKYEVIEELAEEKLSNFDIERLLPHKIFLGNRPSTSIIYNKLNPKTLGSLLALYEHKVFVQGVIWEINSFDQWGVELGKKLAKVILEDLNNDVHIVSHDVSTNGLINYIKKERKNQ